MDGIVFKVRENSKVVNKTIYIAVGLRKDGYKEVLGMWLGNNESAAHWMSVQAALESFEAKWRSKYGYAIKSWKDNWE
jgi:transposase-like protein